jgi:hypothetical protein
LVLSGEEWRIVETLAASMTVRGNLGRSSRFRLDPEHFREHHKDVLTRWIAEKSHAHAITGEPIRDPRHVVEYGKPRPPAVQTWDARDVPDEPFDPDDV